MRPLIATAVLALAVLASATLTGAACAQTSRPFEPVGVWRFFHTDGTPFTARLWADQRAATDWGGGERGIWRWEGDSVRIIYTDGWDDLLHKQDGHLHKSGYAPGANRCGPPSNDTAAERLSADPDARM